jgi:4-amino-4-deoxy-L-arabinose transferase-like glycosyltransferase
MQHFLWLISFLCGLLVCLTWVHAVIIYGEVWKTEFNKIIHTWRTNFWKASSLQYHQSCQWIQQLINMFIKVQTYLRAEGHFQLLGPYCGSGTVDIVPRAYKRKIMITFHCILWQFHSRNRVLYTWKYCNCIKSLNPKLRV